MSVQKCLYQRPDGKCFNNIILRRRDFEKENTSAWVIIHDNAPKLLWDWAVLYSIIFTLFLVPIQYTFRINCTSSMGAIMGQCKDMESTAKGSLFEYEWIVSSYFI